MKRYTAAVIGCGRMGGFIDDEMKAGPLSYFLPHAHAAVYAANPRIDLVAACDPFPASLERFGARYGVPTEKRYSDYKAMIERERPDIVSVTTQPEQRAEIILFACAHGVRAIFSEKALCASMEEADQIVAAVESHNVAFNMGTSRRWDVGFEVMAGLAQDGTLGPLRSVIIYDTGALFNTASHMFDLALLMNGDRTAEWVSAQILRGADRIEGDLLREDPVADAVIGMPDGVRVYALNTRRRAEFEIVCDGGTVSALNNGTEWQLRKAGGEGQVGFQPHPFPDIERPSPHVRLVDDLVRALDTGSPTHGGVRAARANMELIFGCIESHVAGGGPVRTPFKSGLRLARHVQPRAASARG